MASSEETVIVPLLFKQGDRVEPEFALVVLRKVDAIVSENARPSYHQTDALRFRLGRSGRLCSRLDW